MSIQDLLAQMLPFVLSQMTFFGPAPQVDIATLAQSIEYVSEKQMAQLSVSHLKTPLVDGVSIKTPVASYDPELNVMFLRKGLDLTQLKDQRDLVHELVHSIQDISGKLESTCRGLNEKEAYTIEYAWSARNGVPVEYDGIALSLLTSCSLPPPFHEHNL